jgi:hypothetical protein
VCRVEPEKARRFETNNSNVSVPEIIDFIQSFLQLTCLFYFYFYFHSTYIIAALKADPSRPYSLPKLIKLVQMDVESWILHREWIVYVWNQNLVAV